MPDVLFTDADLAEGRADNDASLVDTVGLRHGVNGYGPGGVSGITWDGGDPTWTKPARVSPASAPQEQLTGGSLQDAQQLVIVMSWDETVPRNGTPNPDDIYRLEWTHNIAGLTNPILIYDIRPVELRSFRVLAKFLGTTVPPQ